MGLFTLLKEGAKMGSGNHLSYSERKTRDDLFSQGELWCNHCKVFKSVKKFGKDNRLRGANYGYRYYCKDCESNHKRDKSQAKAYYREKNRGIRKEVVHLAGGKCQRCGYDEFISGFDFHHIHPANKKNEPMNLVYSKGIEGAWNELDKCCLLCRNCHIAYRASEWKAEFIKRDGLGWTVGQDLPLEDNRYETVPPKEHQQATLPDMYRSKKSIQLEMF